MNPEGKNSRDKKAPGGDLKKVVLASAVCLAAGIYPAQAQSINCIRTLNFGSIVSCGSAGTVTVTPAGTLSSSGCVTTVGSASSQGQCLITGSFFPVKPVQASVTAATYTISSTTSSMQVTNINVETAANGLQTTQTTFQFVLDIGGTLNVGANQPTGTYSGTFTVNANFL